jgi:CRISPR-associated exonuclease Cas4
MATEDAPAAAAQASCFAEDELLPLSALQHLAFCERQCALIHVEQVWVDNPLTLEGSFLHDRVDQRGPRHELRGSILLARGLPLRSFRLGLSGRADVVEFRRVAVSDGPKGCSLRGRPGRWQPFPVEYKRGKPKPDACDEVQLCAQAVCLEEMLAVEIDEGALFYGKTEHRHGVRFGKELRTLTDSMAARLHVMVAAGTTPLAERKEKCLRCSLLDVCRPPGGIPGRHRSAAEYLAKAIARSTAEAEGKVAGGSG